MVHEVNSVYVQYIFEEIKQDLKMQAEYSISDTKKIYFMLLSMYMKTVYYLSPSSFCFGVKRSIDQLHDIIAKHPKEKIFCVHALVHNPKVTKEFTEK